MKPFTTLTVLFLAFVAVMQAVRFALAWPLMIADTAIPVWASGIAAVIVGLLAAMLWKESFGWHMPPAFSSFGRKSPS